MIIEQPTIEEITRSAVMFQARITELESALKEIERLGKVGTWPSWEMGGIASRALRKKR